MNSCQICGREFYRKDSLTRHMRVHERGFKVRKRSCNRCQRSKIKCSGDRPQCLACVQREVPCAYSSAPETPIDQHEGSSGDQEKPIAELVTPTSIDRGMEFPIGHQAPPSLSAESDTHELSSISLPPQSVAALPTGGAHEVPQTNTFITDYQDTHFDWMLQDAGDRISFDMLDFSPERMLLDHSASPLLWSPYQTTAKNAQEPASKYKENGAQQEAWLLSAQETSRQPLDIPGLGENRSNPSKGGSYSQLRRLNEADRARILQSAKACLEQPLWEAVSFANFPSKEKLDRCIDIFFVNFQPVLGFIHKPTFDPTTAPETLILAITSIGARFTNLSGAASFANAISKLNRRLLISMGERDPQMTRSEPFITAQLLQAIYGYCSGDKLLFNYSETLRWALIQTAKHVGLFHDASQHNPPATYESTEARWMAWVTAEKRKRLGWAIYELDALVSVLHNLRPAISTGDVTLALPDDVESWEAPSSHSWMALRPRGMEPEPLRFRVAARSCFDPSLADSVQLTDTQHVHIAVVMLGRFVWSLKELQVSPLTDAVPEYLPLSQHKMTLTDKLRDFLVSPHALKHSMLASDRVLCHVVQRALVIHTACLYGASDLMDWLPALLRSAGLNGPARERMTQWGMEDPARVRMVIYHSAQIMAICRDFPFNTPYESFYVFYAGSVLWCAATLLASPLNNLIYNDEGENGNPQADEAILLLDRPPSVDAAEWSFKLLQWVREGGANIRLGLYGVPLLGTVASRVQVLQETVRVLQNMRFWDISQAFAAILRRLIQTTQVTEV